MNTQLFRLTLDSIFIYTTVILCHAIFDRAYNKGIRVIDISDQLRGLLILPAENDPLDSVKANELRGYPEEYLRKARNLTVTFSNINLKMVREDIQEVVNNLLLYLICSLTRQYSKYPVMTPRGVVYEDMLS